MATPQSPPGTPVPMANIDPTKSSIVIMSNNHGMIMLDRSSDEFEYIAEIISTSLLTEEILDEVIYPENKILKQAETILPPGILHYKKASQHFEIDIGANPDENVKAYPMQTIQNAFDIICAQDDPTIMRRMAYGLTHMLYFYPEEDNDNRNAKAILDRFAEQFTGYDDQLERIFAENHPLPASVDAAFACASDVLRNKPGTEHHLVIGRHGGVHVHYDDDVAPVKQVHPPTVEFATDRPDTTASAKPSDLQAVGYTLATGFTGRTHIHSTINPSNGHFDIEITGISTL